MHKDRLGRPLSIGDRVLVLSVSLSIYSYSVYTYYATITRFVESRIYILREGYAEEHYKSNTSDFIYVENQLAVNREQFPEFFV